MKIFNKNSKLSIKLIQCTAFTLTEVLITLGIIGAIDIITVPALKNQIQQEQNVIAWKKAYNTIENAQRAIMNDNGGDINLGFTNIGQNSAIGGENFRNGWIPYLKINKKCSAGKSLAEGCYTGTMKALSDSYTLTDYANISVVPSLVLFDGTVLFFYDGLCGGVFCSDSYIFVDVNGSKLPNRFGKDIFQLHYIPEKKMFMPNIYSVPSCDSNGWSCSQYYLLN